MKASIFVGVSVDGFIARSNDSFDFLSTGGGEPEPYGFPEFLATVDALVMGRRTFEVVLGMSPWPYGDKPVYVLSSRPVPPGPRDRKSTRLNSSHVTTSRMPSSA